MRLGRPAFLAAGLLAATIPACSASSHDDTIAIAADPPHASMAGDVDVTLRGDFAALGALQSVTIGGVRALDVRSTGGGVTVHLQGGPKSGMAEIVLYGDRGTARNGGAFSFDPPAGGAPERWIAFGASLTQGIQSGGLDPRSQRAGYAEQIGRAAGVFLGPPLVVPGVLPPLAPGDFVGDCARSFDAGASANALFAAIADPDTHAIDLRRARLDPTLPTRNIATGGSTLAHVLHGGGGPVRILERIGALPDVDPSSFTAPVDHPQIDRIEALDPDVGFSADLLANDLTPTVTQSDDLHPELGTPVDVAEQEMDEIARRLGALHGQFFLGSLIDLGGLPHVEDLHASRVASGSDTEESWAAKLAVIRALVDAYDAALARAVAPYPNLHVVDLAGAERDAIAGVVVGGATLTGKKFGGLLSLDHMHFSDTGYAIAANVFIRAIDATLHLAIPEIDLAAVTAADPFSPANLAAAGVRCGT